MKTAWSLVTLLEKRKILLTEQKVITTYTEPRAKTETTGAETRTVKPEERVLEFLLEYSYSYGTRRPKSTATLMSFTHAWPLPSLCSLLSVANMGRRLSNATRSDMQIQVLTVNLFTKGHTTRFSEFLHFFLKGLYHFHRGHFKIFFLCFSYVVYSYVVIQGLLW